MGDQVIVPVPYWVSFKTLLNTPEANAFRRNRRGREFRLTPEMIERQITPRTRAIIINTPNNPSGAVLDPSDFTRFCGWRTSAVFTLSPTSATFT